MGNPTLFKFSLKSILEKIESYLIQYDKEEKIHILLSGGNTPLPIYRKFADLNVPWTKVNFWLADERSYPKGHSDRNETMVKEALGSSILKLSKFHSFSSDNPGEMFKEYETHIMDVSVFHLAILGIGEDGHTASLFPGNDLGESESAPNAIPVFNSTKPPSSRVSLSIKRINQSDHILFLVSGDSKQRIVDRVLKGDDLPATKVKGLKTTEILYLTENQ
ncbi:6-phosphogluconolactonase [Leptospira sp. 2 VSF19]|uniref:6-phosphogluconolactonase n=1 Tax=Leptospira soteropolitanensis TaxID=2950025 RepID=A0AAW5VD88_9LEPT|nr:6-phosphogluconolactonase [Leptospira soteropolitanensis]MCW7493165.1 6-phosphogluconolactonase [Leptospira soteropolitanensis]MCW7500766.1 6-phosphogluconolactonase [Leptospira soteropolitanensis]MCW7523015.1 6-phosphogluconolactonase [Leptospira soteropolitanensis]MCW7526878.1 6-phosphogluconolactonase [Leptospira soteropolitanensis]MCW7530733.1 6-phosphogluconolactonase [Leptospira soteropolitanensis]